jgi:Protein of Unknown function (DUF2784)
MSYGTLANIVTALHCLFILSVFIGILICVKYKKFRPLEASILLCAIVIWSLYGGCPLTNIESYLRLESGSPIPINEVGFIPYYLSTWFNLSLTNLQVELFTYGICILFVVISFEWIGGYLHKVTKLKKRPIKSL